MVVIVPFISDQVLDHSLTCWSASFCSIEIDFERDVEAEDFCDEIERGGVRD